MSTLNETRCAVAGIPSRSSHALASAPSSSRIPRSSSPDTLVDRADERARELAAEVRDEVARRAQEPGRRRDDHRERAHHLGDRVRVHRARAAEGDEREVARVVAALHRDEPQRARHVLVDDVEHPLRRLVHVEAERVADLLHGRLRRLDVELHLAAEQSRRQVPDDHVRIGDGRLGAALAVAGGPGLGAGRLRADAKRAGHLGDVGDRASAGAD